MTTAVERIYTAAGSLALAAIASSANLLDNLTTVTGLSATTLLLITLAAIIACALIAVGVLSMQEVQSTEDYRTACRTTMDRDLATIRKQVPHTLPRGMNILQTTGHKDFLHVNDGRRFKVVDRADVFTATAERVRKDGTRAGDREFETGIREANPHQKPSRWHVLWLTSHEARLMQRQADQPAREEAVHTHTHIGA